MGVHYDQLISLAEARSYFPSVDPLVLTDPILQDMIDKIIARCNMGFGIDISNGPGAEVTQTFWYEDYPNNIAYLRLPVDQNAPVTATEGDPPIPVNRSSMVVYGNRLTRNSNFASFYYYDRVTPYMFGFIPPFIVKYTPTKDFFIRVRDLIIKSLRFMIATFNLDGDGEEAFNNTRAVKDDQQEFQYTGLDATPEAAVSVETFIDGLIAKLRTDFGGSRKIG